MEHAGFTPGPWRTTERIWENGRTMVCDVTAGPRVIARISGFTNGSNPVPNARLIADAPALLAERDRLAEENEKLRAALERIQILAHRTIFDCDPPVNFIAEIDDAARLALI